MQLWRLKKRDRIVVGLLDDALLEKLQLDSKPTLEIAVTTASQSEGVHKQQPVVRGKPSDHNTELVYAVHSGKDVDRQKFEHKSGNKAGAGKSVRTPAEQLHNKAQCCPRRGKTPTHGRQQCPARKAICHRCQKKGHFQGMCRTQSKQVQLVTSAEPFFGVVTDSLAAQRGMYQSMQLRLNSN